MLLCQQRKSQPPSAETPNSGVQSTRFLETAWYVLVPTKMHILRKLFKPGIVVQVCNPITWEAEAGGSQTLKPAKASYQALVLKIIV